MRLSLRDLWWRLGSLGLAGRLWSRSFGRVLDVRLLLDWRLDAQVARFAPLPGFRYEQVPVDEQSPKARAGAALLRVRAADRLAQELFVALDPEGRVAACTWNDPPADGTARQRGVAVAPEHRGRALGGSLLLFQASNLGSRGVRTVLYRADLGNRASRRMFHRIGASLEGATMLLVLLGRRAAVRRLKGRAEAFLRRRDEKQRREVTSG